MATKTNNKKSPTQIKADERARERRAAMEQAIAEGRLVVRKMTDAERKAMEAHKAVHGRPAAKKRRRRSHA
jgi:hypothetical protein